MRLYFPLRYTGERPAFLCGEMSISGSLGSNRYIRFRLFAPCAFLLPPEPFSLILGWFTDSWEIARQTHRLSWNPRESHAADYRVITFLLFLIVSFVSSLRRLAGFSRWFSANVRLPSFVLVGQSSVGLKKFSRIPSSTGLHSRERRAVFRTVGIRGSVALTQTRTCEDVDRTWSSDGSHVQWRWQF